MKEALIENIIIIGLVKKDIDNLTTKTINEDTNLYYSGEVLFNYQTKTIEHSLDRNFLSSLVNYAFPKGVVDIAKKNKKRKQYITFCIKSKSQLKHATCLSIPAGIKTGNSQDLIIKTGILVLSSIDVYECQKEILNNIYDILINYFNSNSSNCVYDEKGQKIPEIKVLTFYFNYILNSLIDTWNGTSVCLCSLNNNYNKKVFMKFHIDGIDRQQILPLKEFDLSHLLDRFHFDDLITIYTTMLLEYKIIIIFDKYSEINIILQSLITLLYPLNNNNYQVISFINQSNQNYIDLPCSIIGLHYTLTSMLKSNENVVIYSLLNKKFENIPIGFPAIKDNDLKKEVSSALHYLYGEKLIINTEMNFEEIEMSTIFDELVCRRMNSNLYFNLKIVSIFFQFFLELLKGLNECIVFGKNSIYEKILNIPLFEKNDPFRKKLTKTTMFTNFIVEYSKHSQTIPIYSFIYKMLKQQISNPDYKKHYKDIFTEQIKNKIIFYYNFNYFDMTNDFKRYVNKYKNILYSKVDTNILSLSNLLNFPYDYYTTPKLDNYLSNIITDIHRLRSYELYNIHQSLPNVIKIEPSITAKDRYRSSSEKKKCNSPHKTEKFYNKVNTLNRQNKYTSASNRTSLSTVNNIRRGNQHMKLIESNILKNETTGERIKNKLVSQYMNTNSNKNLSALISSVVISPKHSMKNNNFNERSVNKFELPLQFQSMLAKKEKSNELISEIKEENENKETKHLGIEIPVCGGDDDNNIFSADDN